MESKFVEWFKKAKPWFDSIKQQIEANNKLLKELKQTLKEQEKIIDNLIKKEKNSENDISKKFKKLRHELDIIKNDVDNASASINNLSKDRTYRNGR